MAKLLEWRPMDTGVVAEIGNNVYFITAVTGIKGEIFIVSLNGVPVYHGDTMEQAKDYVQGTLA